MRKFWTSAEDGLMRLHYPNQSMSFLAEIIGRTQSAIYSRADFLGLSKTAEYLDSPHACRLRREATPASIACRFQKGQVPVNKGIKGVNYEGSKATQFTKGARPQNYKPVGTIRQVDGYYEIKIAEGMRQWKLLQRVVWERCNGPIPSGMFVIFLDGTRDNIEITNLSLVTKSQNMKRNSLHNYPKEIAQLIQLQGAINRQINKRTGQSEQNRHA